jgi:membrane protein CcdC involved in cytochrome C biogenesis
MHCLPVAVLVKRLMMMFVSPAFSAFGSLAGMLAVLAWRVREGRTAVTLGKIVIPPLGMATGFSMFLVPAFQVPWTWAIIYASDPAKKDSDPYRVHLSEIIGPRSLTRSEAKSLKNQWVIRQLGSRRGVRPDPCTTVITFAESVYFPEV